MKKDYVLEVKTGRERNKSFPQSKIIFLFINNEPFIVARMLCCPCKPASTSS